MKKFVKRLVIETVGAIFYDKKYLTGRYFEGDLYGAKWLLQCFWSQKFGGTNSDSKWPVSPKVTVVNSKNIFFSPNDLHIFQTFGTYFQAIDAKIIIGEGTYIAPNVGLITTNHDPENLDKHLLGKNIVIGKKCWIGMNAIILPGVKLGDGTIVGAGSVVTKSFESGMCTIAGNPAKIITYRNSQVKD